MEATDTVIKIQNISKRYRTVNALNDFSLDIPRGTIYGLIGPNGAGKTTLLRILAALISPTTGQVWFENEEVTRSPSVIQRKVGYMPDFFGVYPDLTATEYLEFYAGIHGIPRNKHKRVISDLLELVDLSSKRDEMVETLSRGMKQRLCLARALVHDPEVLLLDEPASGLDPRARVELRELLRTLQDMKKTIVISSHILLEMAEMCSDVAIMQGGRLVLAGGVDTVTHRLGGSRQLEIRLLEQERVSEAMQLLKDMAEISEVSNDEGTTLLQAEFSGDDAAMSRILAELITKGLPVVSFAPRSSGGRLEDVFMSITEGSTIS
ncbi:ABC transporter [Reticulibacter mediterranei]|uniref:ABC transporter n=1 Tax=Reticulibacter mediterranei TaxID=2778369 RepID=A0A8J3INH5_9CHLR|nr:ABC transporter ATP-binding protein [Reticulibacter mediterranei]GHO95638.1 ABC transporter [Reticulibacter mediterranei]